MEDRQRINVVINRKASGLNYFLPQFDMVFKEDYKHIISCKKQLGAGFEYLISTSQMNFASDSSEHFQGKVTANFTNQVFTIYNKNSQPIATSLFHNEENVTIVAPRRYKVFLLK